MDDDLNYDNEIRVKRYERRIAELEAQLASLQRIKAAARRVLTDGHTGPPYYLELQDHDETLNQLRAALDPAAGG